MKHLELKELTRYLKKNLKKKVSISKALVISYILTGLVGIQSMAEHDVVEDGKYVVRVNEHHVWLGKSNKFLRHNNPETEYVIIGKNIESDMYAVGVGLDNFIGQRSIAYGMNVYNNNLYTVALGIDLRPINSSESIVMGRDIQMKGGTKSLVLGKSIDTEDSPHSVILGLDLKETGKTKAENSVIIGKKVKTDGDTKLNGAILIGTDSGMRANGRTWQATIGKGNAITAIGSGAQSLADQATALGFRAVANGEKAISLGSLTNASGKRSVALGDLSKATLENSVALGSGSVTKESRNQGYLIDGTYEEKNYTRVAAFGGRRLQDILAGAEDTDAVNVLQLKNALKKKISFVPVYVTPNNPNVKEVSLDGSIKIGVGNWNQTDAQTQEVIRFAGDNLSTTATNDGIMIAMKESPKFKSLKLGEDGQVDIKLKDKNTLLLNDKGISGLNKGTNDNDAVNLAQLKTGEDIDVTKWAEKLKLKNLELNLFGNVGTSKKTTLAQGIKYKSPILKIEAKENGEVHFELNEAGENKIKQLSKASISLKAQDNDPIKVEESNGAYTLSLEKDKLKNLVETQNLAGKDLDNLTDKAKGNIKKLLEVKGDDKDIKVVKSTSDGKDVYTVSLESAIKDKIERIGKGEVTEGDTNLVTGGQVNQAITNVKNELINKGIQFSGDSGEKITTKLGEEIKFQGGKTSDLTENNIGVINENGIMKIKLAKNISGLKAINLGDVKLSDEGLDVGSHKITKLSDGINDNDAVNLKQLREVLDKTVNKAVINVQADSPMVVALKHKDGTLEKVVKDPNDGKYYKISDMEGTKHKKDATPVSKDNGDDFVISTIDEDGGLAATKSIKITKVKDGDITKESTDAINGGQLAKILGIDGKTYKIDDNGKIVKVDGKPLYDTIKSNPSTTPSNALEATNAIIAAINKGIKIKADDDETKDKNLGDTIALIHSKEEKDGYSGKNLKTYLTNNGEFALLFNMKPIFTEVTVGDDQNGKTVLGKDGLTIKGQNGKEGKITIDDKGKLAIKDGDKTSTLVTEESAKQNLKLSYKVNDETTGKSTGLEQGLTFKSADIKISSEDKGVINFNIDKASDIDDANKDKLVTVDVIKKYVDKQKESGNKVTGDNSDGTAEGIDDGLNGKTLTEKINALRNGEAGPMVYTDKDGNKLKRGSDGKLYKPSDLNDDGTVKDGKEAVKNVELKLKGDDPVALNNVANAVEKVSDLTDNDDLVDGYKAINKNDLQKVVKAGLNIKGNKGETHQNLGSSLEIKGEGNIETSVEDGKLTITMKKEASFEDGVKLGKGNIELNANDDGNKLTLKGKDQKNVILDGVNDGKIEKDSKEAINGGQINNILSNLGVNSEGKPIDGTNKSLITKILDKDGKESSKDPETLVDAINRTIERVNDVFTIKDDNNGEMKKHLGSEIVIQSLKGQDSDFSGDNVKVQVSDGKIEIGMKKNPTFESVQLGDGANALELSYGNGGLMIKPSDGEAQKILTDKNVNEFGPIKINEGVATIDSPNKEPVILRNLSDGVELNDAVNVKQLKAVKSTANFALGGVANAVAMANLLQVNSYSDYRRNIAVACGYYGHQYALAVGFSGVNEKRRVNYRISGSVNTQGNLALGGGIGIMLGKKEERYAGKLEKLNVAKLLDRIDELEKDKISDRKEIENLKKENQEIKEMLKKILKK
ncbi:YadA-like family protein [uncultured Sneathia sp.]|uniref:YadA-like family protein n=1 Tax=uncultured Sneathia sp. TaxID=278067 RepID=UPI002804B359|nr:YadA-like family protein [uncultured Sneathia sp.]